MKKSRRKYIILTGFGKFHGVKENPSSIIVQKLSKNKGTHHLLHTKIVDVSINGVTKYFQMIDSTYSQLINNESLNEFIFVHLGVSGRQKNYHIENCAKNEATFGCFDEGSNKPQKMKIDQEKKIEFQEKTKCDVKRLEKCVNQMMNKKGVKNNSIKVKIQGGDLNLGVEIENYKVCELSEDCGLFICNYMYFSSMMFTRKRKNCKSLFIHIPHHTTIGIDDQLVFVKTVLKDLYDNE